MIWAKPPGRKASTDKADAFFFSVENAGQMEGLGM